MAARASGALWWLSTSKPMPILALVPLLVLSLLSAGRAQAQGAGAEAGRIYSCTDARGRTLTSDRPIADCIDREQRELNPSGSTRRRIEPTYTAREVAEREERQRQAAIAALRLTEERRRERALITRYPSAAIHDRERAEALAQIDAVIAAAKRRLGELADARRKLDEELEFYRKDLSKAPASVRQQLDDNTRSTSVQSRFIAEQEAEQRRLNARFDEERARLRPLWAAEEPAPARSASPR